MCDTIEKCAMTQMIDGHRVMDLHHRNADAISHALFDEIRHLLPQEIEGDVFRELWEAVYRNGTMIISDNEADHLGLEPKDREGWTFSERVKMKLDHLSVMHQVMSVPVVSSSDI